MVSMLMNAIQVKAHRGVVSQSSRYVAEPSETDFGNPPLPYPASAHPRSPSRRC